MATQFLLGIASRFDLVAQFPLSGVARPQLAPEVRATFHQGYAIYYVPRQEGVVIVRVLHGSRDRDSIGIEEGFALG